MLLVAVEPLNDDCIVLALISQSTDIVMVRAETAALYMFSHVVRLYSNSTSVKLYPPTAGEY